MTVWIRLAFKRLHFERLRWHLLRHYRESGKVNATNMQMQFMKERFLVAHNSKSELLALQCNRTLGNQERANQYCGSPV